MRTSEHFAHAELTRAAARTVPTWAQPAPRRVKARPLTVWARLARYFQTHR